MSSITVPPVVIPSSGNNIVISPLQVHAHFYRKRNHLLTPFTARESSLGMY